MTKAEIVSKIAKSTGMERQQVITIVESFMDTVKGSIKDGDNVYLRGFGTFLIKHRAEKVARNISKNTSIVIPAHSIPGFRPAKEFMDSVKESK